MKKKPFNGLKFRKLKVQNSKISGILEYLRKSRGSSPNFTSNLNCVVESYEFPSPIPTMGCLSQGGRNLSGWNSFSETTMVEERNGYDRHTGYCQILAKSYHVQLSKGIQTLNNPPRNGI